MYCASAGKEDFVELLLQNHANTLLESLDGFKAIDLAVTPKIVKMLKDANLHDATNNDSKVLWRTSL